jgi:hypothetical protein
MSSKPPLDPPDPPDPADPREVVEDFYRRIDARARELAARHAARLSCRRGCSACCLDDLTVSPVEAERIRTHHAALLATAAPHPAGACAFLDAQGSCRIYAERPAVCRSQGLPLRVLFEDEDDEIVERRDICPLNEAGGPPIDSLDEQDCWLIGPFELELGQLEEARFGEEVPRVALRSLFSASASKTSDS